jgi:hypothetical protein
MVGKEKKMEIGSLVKEHLFTNRKGEVVERYGVIIRKHDTFKGYVEVVWQPRKGHPVSAEAHVDLTPEDKLEVVVPPTNNKKP